MINGASITQDVIAEENVALLLECLIKELASEKNIVNIEIKSKIFNADAPQKWNVFKLISAG